MPSKRSLKGDLANVVSRFLCRSFSTSHVGDGMGWMPVSLLPPTYNACLERLDLGEEIPPPAEDQESNNGPYTLIKNFFLRP